ncbi:hypothetical protein [Salinibacterium sp. NK8237]|uniref:hypothetical protein n=1 Tax=Salinibacterium sp. NK8237 TaxID=2792038 RepID=UPI0018CDA3C1|nr:hypothetical protein [Salinibacterium sp. NK8237]MBH0130595.1 hypothetical protein [Salinibacterium sp. NK8237]
MAVATLAITAVVLVTQTRADVTEAAWVDGEYAQASITAATIAPPVIDTCSLSPGFAGLNPVVTMKWGFPAGSNYTAPSNVEYFVASGGLLGSLTSAVLGTSLSTSGPVSGTYTTQFKSGILGGLLSGSYGVFVQTKDPSGWTSAPASATASMGFGGANPQCVITAV